jgi:hypothetical protein
MSAIETTPVWTHGISWNDCRLVQGAGWWWSWSVEIPESPIEVLLREIERALDARLYYLAVIVSLTVPDICSCAEADNSRTSPDKYKAWFEKWMSERCPGFDPADCYSLRCGILHEGRLEKSYHRKMGYDRVLFTVPSPSRNTYFNMEIEGALVFDAIMFCRQMISAARTWAMSTLDDSVTQNNLQNLVRYRPYGLPPYITGVPLIG